MMNEQDLEQARNRAISKTPAQKTYEDYVVLAEHYLIVRGANCPLFTQDDADKPWSLVTGISWVEMGGGGMGYDVAGRGVTLEPSIKFIAPHPCGLNFQWNVDLIESNAIGIPEINIERLEDIMERLRQSKHSGRCRADLLRYAGDVTYTIRSAARSQKLRAEEFLASCAETEDALKGMWDN